jgi:hypothetical protein
MRDDLLDAQASVNWAVAQLPRLGERIEAWHNDTPYRIVIEPHPEMGKQLIKLRDIKPLPAIINAEVGAIINSIRSSLDLLAAALARRNGKTPSADTHFPIFSCLLDFIDPISGIDGRECKKWLSEGERAIIKALKPYPAGNGRLVALHKLDVTRKHDRLINVRLVPASFIVSPESWAQGFGMPAVWAGFREEAVLAWHSMDATECQFYIPLQITFDEGSIVANHPVEPALRNLASLADSIINVFDG